MLDGSLRGVIDVGQVSMNLHVRSHYYVIEIIYIREFRPLRRIVRTLLSPLKRRRVGITIFCTSESRWQFIRRMSELRTDSTTKSGGTNVFAAILYLVAQTNPA